VADLAGTSQKAAVSLSQMFNDCSTLKQLAFEMEPCSKLSFDSQKFNQLRTSYPEYEKVFDDVAVRLTEMLK